MARLFLLLVLLASPAFGQGCKNALPLLGVGCAPTGGGGATFGVVVQKVSAVYITNCSFASPSPCTFSVSALGSGHLLLVLATRNNASASEYITSVTAGACSGSWQMPVSSQTFGSAGSVEAAYCLSSVAGVTSITVQWLNWQGRPVLEFYEISYTGTPSFVNANKAVNGSLSTSPAGVALTLSGATAYTTCQLMAEAFGVPTAITSPYNTDFLGVSTSDSNNFAAFSCVLNSVSGTAPTWTTPNSVSVSGGIAFGVN